MPEYEYFVTVERAVEISSSIKLDMKTETVLLDEAERRILSEDVVSLVDDPPFDNSSMDGYAVIQSDTNSATEQNPVSLEVIGEVRAAETNQQLIVKPGTAARIMTGAPMPPGADAIIMIEKTITNDENSEVKLIEPSKSNWVRKKGENIKQGQVALPKGTFMKAAEIGLAATMGHPTLPVISKLKIMVISTGDELVSTGEPLEHGQIYESNSHSLATLISELGHTPIRIPSVSDSIDKLRTNLDLAASVADVIITSGGVSMGDWDLVRKLMEEEGELKFWRAKLRPGSPPLFGTWKGTPLFGLPGNPVSGHCVFHTIVRPWIQQITGATGPSDRVVKVKLLENLKSVKDCLTMRRIRIEHTSEGLVATQPTHQGSGNLHSLVAANGLTLLPPGAPAKEGEYIDAIYL